MKKNEKIFIVSMMAILLGGFSYNLLINSNTMERQNQNRKEMIAMYVQDEDGNYQMPSLKEFPKEGYFLNLEKSTCKSGGMLSQESDTKKVKVKLAHSDQCTLYFDKEVPKVEIGDIVLKVQDKTPNFAEPAKTDETADGLFAMEDDYGMSYYFRGAVENNYFKFGRNANGEDMWWRIIRFNGDGSIRMQYDGTGASGSNTYTRDFALTKQVWNSNYGDAKYAGWMFGGTNGSVSTSKEEAQRNETSSEIKIAVDNWYKNNIVDTGYSDFVHDTIFCNDRSTPGKNLTGWNSDTELGFGNNNTAYGATARFYDKQLPQPQFTCPQNNDKFTVETESKGNGALTYPVGLITADEIVTAGSGRFEDAVNSLYYLYKEIKYWSYSPGTAAPGWIFCINGSGGLSGCDLDYKSGIAPVINIKPEYINQIRGTGTTSNPFHLSS